MRKELMKVLFYTFCLLNCPVNLSTVKDEISEETSTSKIHGEGSRMYLRVRWGSPTVDKIRMVRSNDNKPTNTSITNPKAIHRLVEHLKKTEDSLDIIFDDKSREAAYKRTVAENSPYSLILLMMFDKPPSSSKCTGSLLTPSLVLTAAHCLFTDDTTSRANNVTLYAGANDFEEIWNDQPSVGSQKQVSTEFYIHPDFKIDSAFDVAVVRAPGEFNLTTTVNIINLSDRPWGTGSKECTLTGFGSLTKSQKHVDDYTRKTQQLKIQYPCHCSTALNRILKAGTYLCSVSKDPYDLCTGDFGAGLICDGHITGIAMFTVGLYDAEACEIDEKLKSSCGGKKTKSIFQDLYLVRDWLKPYLTAPDWIKPSYLTAPPPVTTLETPKDGRGCNIKLATGLLLLSMITNII